MSALVSQVSADFDIQSQFGPFFEKYVLPQTPGEGIVASTLKKSQTSGYAIGLHPSSETPVAIRFRGIGTDTAPVILTPGQTIRLGQRFTGFEWGLPFGWLGGGRAMLYVAQVADAKIEFAHPSSDVLFHRVRVPIYDPALGDAVQPANWPTQFPWPFAIRNQGTGDVSQASGPVLNVKPTRVLMRVPFEPAVAPADLTIVMTSNDGFGDRVKTVVSIPSQVLAAVTMAPFLFSLDAAFASLGINRLAAGVPAATPLVPYSTDANLIGQYVEFLRYGKFE